MHVEFQLIYMSLSSQDDLMTLQQYTSKMSNASKEGRETFLRRFQ